MDVLTNTAGDDRSSPTGVVDLVFLRVVSPHLLPLSPHFYLDFSSQDFQDIGFLNVELWDIKLSKLELVVYVLTHSRALTRKRDEPVHQGSSSS